MAVGYVIQPRAGHIENQPYLSKGELVISGRVRPPIPGTSQEV